MEFFDWLIDCIAWSLTASQHVNLFCSNNLFVSFQKVHMLYDRKLLDAYHSLVRAVEGYQQLQSLHPADSITSVPVLHPLLEEITAYLRKRKIRIPTEAPPRTLADSSMQTDAVDEHLAIAPVGEDAETSSDSVIILPNFGGVNWSPNATSTPLKKNAATKCNKSSSPEPESTFGAPQRNGHAVLQCLDLNPVEGSIDRKELSPLAKFRPGFSQNASSPPAPSFLTDKTSSSSRHTGLIDSHCGDGNNDEKNGHDNKPYSTPDDGEPDEVLNASNAPERSLSGPAAFPELFSMSSVISSTMHVSSMNGSTFGAAPGSLARSAMGMNTVPVMGMRVKSGNNGWAPQPPAAVHRVTEILEESGGNASVSHNDSID